MPTLANHPMFRPPAEADSMILQVDVGCPYNACTFCGMYKGVPYCRRTPADVEALIHAESHAQPEATRVFLADGDVMLRPFAELDAMLRLLGGVLPRLARVNTYATGRAILRHTPDQLRALRDRKLHTLYMGLESGDETTLRAVRKAETAEQMVEAGQRAAAAGLKMSVMVLLGLGSSARTDAHAAATAAILNRMQPALLSFLRVVPVPGTELHAQVEAGVFDVISEHAVVDELRRIVAELDLRHTVVRANHTSNVFPLEGRLPKDKPQMLNELAALLRSGRLDRRSPGPLPLFL